MLYPTAATVAAFVAYMGIGGRTLIPAETLPLNTTTIAKLQTSGTHTGEGTIYYQFSTASSCGPVNPDSAFIAALGDYWMNWAYRAPYCGLLLHVTNTGSNDGVGGAGNSIVVQVADTCEACDENHVDFSLAAWNMLTGGAAPGTIHISWSFCEGCQLSGPGMSSMNQISSGPKIEVQHKWGAAGWLLVLLISSVLYSWST